MLKRIVVFVIVLAFSFSCVYSEQGNIQAQEEMFMKTFAVFIEQITSDITPAKVQVDEKPGKKNKSKKVKKAEVSDEVSSQNFVSDALKAQFKVLKKYKNYLNILQIGRSLEIESGYENYGDVFPKKFIFLQLGRVEKFRNLNPEVFTLFRNDDFCLYVKEEYGNGDDRIVYSERAIIFSAKENDNFKIIGSPTISLRDEVSAK